MGWREGDMTEGEQWPEDVVRSYIEGAARQHGQQSVWTGVAQLIARLDADLSRTIKDAAKQDRQRQATHDFHTQTINQLRSDNLRLRSKVQKLERANA